MALTTPAQKPRGLSSSKVLGSGAVILGTIIPFDAADLSQIKPFAYFLLMVSH
jgi:hypothetical protein